MDSVMSEEVLFWLSVGSGIALAIGAVATPWIVVRLPEDYFFTSRQPSWLDRQPEALRLPLRLLKNLLAVLLVLLGIAMLVLPGQGIMTILAGVVLGDFPGKPMFQRWLFTNAKVLDSLNWLRRKYHRPPFRMPSPDVKLAA